MIFIYVRTPEGFLPTVIQQWRQNLKNKEKPYDT